MRRVGELHALRERRREPSRAPPATSRIDRGSGGAVRHAGDRGRGHRQELWRPRRSCSDFSIRILRGDRIGIVGPNGGGKTTLINMLTGALAPDAGTVRLGTNLEIATLDQRRDSLDPERHASPRR